MPDQSTRDIVGFSPIPGFAESDYVRVHNLIIPYKYKNKDIWREFAGGWNAILYRTRACKDYSEEYCRSIRAATNAPPPEERYLQEKSLFGFFTNGVASIESTCYALYALGGLFNPSDFQLATETERRKITPDAVTGQFAIYFPGENITLFLTGLFGDKSRDIRCDPQYEKWVIIRNKLVHRISPPRNIYTGGDDDGNVIWLNTHLDENTTNALLSWLLETINRLIRLIREFVENQVSRP